MTQTYGNTKMPESTRDRPLVTFALFAFNQEKYIREAVEGALSQTYSPLEIILSDDCSTDRTFEIMQEMAEGYKGPHKVVTRRHGKNMGLFPHFMNVFKTANGAITVVAAGDDCSLPQRTSEIVSALKNHPRAAAACSSVERIDETGKSAGLYSPPLIERLGFLDGPMDHLLGCSAAYVTEHVKSIPSSTVNDIAEDAFLSHALQLQGFKVLRIPEALVRYRVAENNLSIMRSGGWKYTDYLSLENRKKRRLSLNCNTYRSIDAYNHLVDSKLRKRALNRNLLLLHVNRASAMLRSYHPWAIFDLDFAVSAVRDFEIFRFVVVRIFGLRFSYFLFLMRQAIRIVTPPREINNSKT